ncbi:hypothetical protein RD792_013181 [Penstemon davidsonii]|uniref:Uncharacterized protein n=1 Tax=Penstemon davidsonii TaxID=160366 RepID=A0ABR0CSR9_9LAMI|nr:hypothetical protein RD792_013181 [Penstemon davidsonii]
MVPPKWIKFEIKLADEAIHANWVLGGIQKNDSGFSDSYPLVKVVGSSGSDLRSPEARLKFESYWRHHTGDDLYHLHSSVRTVNTQSSR